MQSACRRISRSETHRRAEGNRRRLQVRVVDFWRGYRAAVRGSIEWEDWVRGPRSEHQARVGPLSLSFFHSFSLT